MGLGLGLGGAVVTLKRVESMAACSAQPRHTDSSAFIVVERPLLPPLLPALLWLPVLPDRTTSSGGMRKPVPADAATMRKKKNTNKGTFPLLLLLEK